MDDFNYDCGMHPSTTVQTNYIRQLQIYLREMAFLYDSVPEIAVDGIAGVETTTAITEFQKISGIEPTGVADPITWDILKKNYINSKNNRTPNLGFVAFPPDDLLYDSGEYHPGIFSVQHAFLTLSNEYDNFLNPDFNGTIDEITSQNIREFRRVALLPDGTHIDKDLWNRLALIHNYITGN